jgi:hypothetical protein
MDPSPSPLLLADDHLGVDLMEHGDTGAGSCRDLRRRDTGVQPCRHRRVPQVVRSASKRGSDLGGRQRRRACLPPDPAIGALREEATAHAAEEQTIPAGLVKLQMGVQERGQLRGRWDNPGLTAGTMLQLAFLAPSTLSVHEAPASGVDASSTRLTQPSAGNARLDFRSVAASPGRRAE